MKNCFIFLLSITFFSCNSYKNSGEKDLLKFEAFPLLVPEHNSLMARWEEKPILETRLIDDMDHDTTRWEVTGIGEIVYTQDRAKDGKQSLRFHTSLRDEEHYRSNRTAWNSFDGEFGGFSGIQIHFSTPQDWSAYNRISFWVYVHPTSIPTYCLYLEIKNDGTTDNATTPRGEHFIQDLKPGMWNHVLFEIPHLERNKVILFSINQELIGHHPEEEGIVTYDFDQLELQLVEADQYEGWNVTPGKFAFSHVGYRPGDLKVAMVGSGAGKNFQLIDQKDKVVFSGDVHVIENKNGVFNLLDFSDFQKEGMYHIRCGSLKSHPFPIDEDIWLQPLFKAINFFFCERCGYPVPGIHLECHKDWQGFYGDQKKIINGGWHDAGDLSQGSWRTSMATFAMMRNLEVLQERPDVAILADKIRSEIAWGLEWLLKTRFGDGFHMSFSVMRIYTDNQVGTIDDVVSPAENVPWENFLASAVEGKAARLLEKSNPELAQKASIAAFEDWEAAMTSRDNWDQADYIEAAWGVTSSLILGELTSDNKYNEHAVRFGRLLVQCQEQKFIDGIPITGYFYTNTDRRQVIHNYHAAFEEAPLIALAMLCEKFPEHENWIDWYSAAVLHSEFFLKQGSQIASPYDLLPNSVWIKTEIMEEKDKKSFEAMQRQFNEGFKLNEEYVLRTFPIYHDDLFHGNTNIQMSGTWALAEAARLRNDSDGMQLVGKQLQWVLGANPFGQSLMYGVGYDFAPHFASRLKDLVGSLPVGMDCMSGDRPYWPASNYATYKEIWVEPVSRFLGAVSIYASQEQLVSGTKETGKEIQVQAETIQENKEIVAIAITVKGSGKHKINIKTFNAKSNFSQREVDLSGIKTERIQLELKIADWNMPYIAVIDMDKNPELRKEIVGSFINASFLVK